MISRIALVFFACWCAPAAHASFNCDDVPGQWWGDRFEESLDAERTSLITFYPDGHYRFEFHTFNESSDQHAVDIGVWVCTGNRIIFSDRLVNGTASGNVHAYEILELDATYFVFKAIAADCNLFVGDCEGVVYGLTRLAASLAK